MKKLTALVGLLVVLSLGSSLQAQTNPDETLFREAKLLVYDKSWEAALDKLEELRDKYPDSPWAGQALFYKGECLSGLGGRERDALRAYKEYIQLAGAMPSLVEESEGSIIDLAFTLYEKGDASAIRDIESRLGHGNKVVRYYAAYKLSFVQDKKLAAKAAPILMRVVETEKDAELLDRARIALLRVSPESLKSVEDRHPRSESPRMLRIRIWDKGGKEPVFSLNIPWALADLALGAMDEEDKATMRKKGYDLNRIVNELAKSKESILKIVGDDGSIIEIWID
jgi:tetratricopeptide (TPR) repeat protein